MTPEERERLNDLCLRVQQEQDPDKLSALVRELNEFFEQREEALWEKWKKLSNNPRQA